MGLPELGRFTLEEVATRWGKPVSYVEEMARTLRFKYIIIEGENTSGSRQTWHIYFGRTLWPKKYGSKRTTLTIGRQEVAALWLDSKEWHRREKSEVVYIPRSALEACEKVHDINSAASPVSPLDLSRLDVSKVSESLRIAIAADTHLYAQNQIRQNLGHREQIDTWLRREYPHLTENRRGHIVSVVNRHLGGSPRSR